jgi:hypothetical protein
LTENTICKGLKAKNIKGRTCDDMRFTFHHHIGNIIGYVQIANTSKAQAIVPAYFWVLDKFFVLLLLNLRIDFLPVIKIWQGKV